MASASLAHLLPVVAPAFHRKEIANGLRRLCTDSALYWNAIPDEEFVAPLGGAWSPAENVRHLTTSVRAVSRGLGIPKLLLRLAFRGRRGVSRRYDVLVKTYHTRLQRGGQAGRFAPSMQHVTGDPAAYRREVLDVHRASVEQLADRLMRWNRSQVDNLLLPHPLLGNITAREMLMFTLYHNWHHVMVVARRRGEYFSDATPLKGS